MKILTVIDSLPVTGGAERLLVSVLPALRLRGHHCEVAALWPPYELADDLERAGIKVHRLDIPGHWSLRVGVSRLASVIRSGVFDVVHAHLFFAEIYTAMTAPFANRPRRIVTFHMADPYEQRLGRRYRIICRIRRMAARHGIDAAWAVSRAVAEDFRNELGLGPIPVIYNAIGLSSPDENAAQLRAACGAGPDSFLISCVGRIVPQKDHRCLLEAIDMLRSKDLTPKVVIAGRGALAAQIRTEIAARGLENQITMLEAVSHPRAIGLMGASDAVVLPTLLEGMPIVLGEAMALGRPVIASAVGGIPEMIDDGITGLLVPPSSPEALADAVQRLMGDFELRERIGRAARRGFEERFSVDRIVPQWERFYQLTAARGCAAAAQRSPELGESES